jgi:hypothetical protein
MVVHRRSAPAVRAERRHPARLEVRSGGVVDLEVEYVVRDEGEERLA